MQGKSIHNSWEFNVLNVYNYLRPGPYSSVFEFISKHQATLKGDILESGVYRGRMTLALGMFLRNANLPGLVHGFDTFSGFPSVSYQDANEQFDFLFKANRIDQEHFNRITQMRGYATEILQRDSSPMQLSSSGSFVDARYDELCRKIEFLGLNNIRLHVGTFSETMNQVRVRDLSFSMIFLDCDLYEGYIQTLVYGWPRLQSGGMVFLDEYYSLKFPGARIAVDEFLSGITDYEKINVASEDDDFERWVLFKK
jgi:hypothetical protein